MLRHWALIEKDKIEEDTRDTRIETVYRYKDKDRDYGQRLELL